VSATHRELIGGPVRHRLTAQSDPVVIWESTARQATTDQQGAFELRGLSRTPLRIAGDQVVVASPIGHDTPVPPSPQ
jgi:hypothetical protein